MPELKTYRAVGAIECVWVPDNILVVECPKCHALVSWGSNDAHDQWHADTDLTLERFKRLEVAAHMAETERVHRERMDTDKEEKNG